MMREVTWAELDRLYEVAAGFQPGAFRLAAFDMDGTLLNRSHRLSRRTIEAVTGAAGLGITPVLATGRMMSAVYSHLWELGVSGIAISHNGALVQDTRTRTVHIHHTVSQTVAVLALKLAQEHRAVIHLNFSDDIYLSAPNQYSNQYSIQLGVPLKFVPSLDNVLEDLGEPTTILIMGARDKLDCILSRLSGLLEGQFGFVLIPWQEDIWQLQLLHSNTSKGKGVLEVASLLGILPQEILSFGDSYNDMEMRKNSGLGVAMGNAVPELKEAAGFVTLTNEEDGVAHVLEVLLSLWR